MSWKGEEYGTSGLLPTPKAVAQSGGEKSGNLRRLPQRDHDRQPGERPAVELIAGAHMHVQEHPCERRLRQLLGGGPADAEALGGSFNDAGVHLNHGRRLVCGRHDAGLQSVNPGQRRSRTKEPLFEGARQERRNSFEFVEQCRHTHCGGWSRPDAVRRNTVICRTAWSGRSGTIEADCTSNMKVSPWMRQEWLSTRRQTFSVAVIGCASHGERDDIPDSKRRSKPVTSNC